jgi:glycosyltransferase involved in cell wall biosynthesis
MPSLSIVYVWDADYPWDVRTEKICSTLVDAGHRVTIVARNKEWAPEREILPEGTVQRMRPWRWAGRALDGLLGFPAFFSPRWSQLLRKATKASAADLIIVRDLPLCLTAIAVGKEESIPVMLDMAENYPAMMRDRQHSTRSAAIDMLVRNPRAIDLIERYCVKRVDWTLTVVEESSKRLTDMGTDPRRLTVVSNTPPRRRVEPAAQRKEVGADDTITVAYLGLLEAARGIGDLVDAMKLLRDAYGAKFRAIIVGGGRDAELFVNRARSLGILDTTVKFLGRLPHHEALRAIADANVGVIPHHATESWNTTIPNKLFDYMAAGLPVVSSDTKPCARILLETGCGELFRSGDAASMAKAVISATSPGVSERMAMAGRRAILDRYNWENDAAALLDAVRLAKKG